MFLHSPVTFVPDTFQCTKERYWHNLYGQATVESVNLITLPK
uniref:Uncharacterized protein n=1 Tax=Anguilla anguilla TaxID=7936 RepID=A0A0E9UJH5_ANGAN